MNSKMKFRAHETFFIRKGWLSKGMKYIKNTNGEVFISKNKNETPSDVLGLGSNMVKALRYWLLATGLTEEKNSGKHIQLLTPLGQLIFKHDKYIEETGTLQTIHYKLASNREFVTSWYYFFNQFSYSEFTVDDFILDIQKWIKKIGDEQDSSKKIRALTDDFNCIINSYLHKNPDRTEEKSPENNIDCPLAELKLIGVGDKKKKTFRKLIPSVKNFNPWITLAILLDSNQGKTQIQLNALLNDLYSIGKIFNLDSISLIELLREVEKIGELKIIRTAGLDVIQITNPNQTFLQCIEKYYQSIQN